MKAKRATAKPVKTWTAWAFNVGVTGLHLTMFKTRERALIVKPAGVKIIRVTISEIPRTPKGKQK